MAIERSFVMLSTATRSIAVLLTAVVATAAGGEWSNLRGRIVYDGTPPVPPKIKVNKDEEVCGNYDLVDERLLVNAANHGIKNVIVTLVLGRGETTEVHPSYLETQEGNVALDNTHCRFDPHVILLRTTQKLVIRNLDPIGNNVRIDVIKNQPINITVPFETKHEQRFPNVELMPARISCSIHSWELGWLVVKDHPYTAVTDDNGDFEIKNLPAGKRKFMFWQEKAGYLREITHMGKPQNWPRGTVELDLPPGDLDLQDIVVPASLFGGKTPRSQ